LRVQAPGFEIVHFGSCHWPFKGQYLRNKVGDGVPGNSQSANSVHNLKAVQGQKKTEFLRKCGLGSRECVLKSQRFQGWRDCLAQFGIKRASDVLGAGPFGS
jgi:hypothetical protein